MLTIKALGNVAAEVARNLNVDDITLGS